MKAVILAGGLGSRLRPFTQVIPKPLLPVGASSVLEIQIGGLKKAGCDHIYVAAHYRAEYIEAFVGDGTQYGIPITLSTEQKPLGTCGPVTLLRDELTEPFVLMNGDILTTLSYAKLHRFAERTQADLTVTTKEIVTPFHFGKVISDGDYIVDVEEKPDLKLEILAGIYVLTPAVFEVIPTDAYYGIDDLIRDMLDREMAVARFPITDYWLDIGQPGDYEVAQDAFDEHFENLGSRGR